MKTIKGFTKEQVLEMAQELSRDLMEEGIVDCLMLPAELEDFLWDSDCETDCEDFTDWVFKHNSEECVTKLVDTLIERLADRYNNKLYHRFGDDDMIIDFLKKNPAEVESEIDKLISDVDLELFAKDYSKDLIKYMISLR